MFNWSEVHFFGSISYEIHILAGSSKMAPKILIFSIAMDADYSLELISIETYAPQFIGHNKIFLGSVQCIEVGFLGHHHIDDNPPTSSKYFLGQHIAISGFLLY